MKVDVNMRPEDEFNISMWWAKSPEFVINALQQQLEAAAAIWPELAAYRISKTRATKGTAGRAGGIARAAALTSESRSEIARKAANARWGTDTESVA